MHKPKLPLHTWILQNMESLEHSECLLQIPGSHTFSQDTPLLPPPCICFLWVWVVTVGDQMPEQLILVFIDIWPWFSKVIIVIRRYLQLCVYNKGGVKFCLSIFWYNRGFFPLFIFQGSPNIYDHEFTGRFLPASGWNPDPHRLVDF